MFLSQVFGTTDMGAMDAGHDITKQQNGHNATGFELVNVTPYWMSVRNDSSALLALIAPYHSVGRVLTQPTEQFTISSIVKFGKAGSVTTSQNWAVYFSAGDDIKQNYDSDLAPVGQSVSFAGSIPAGNNEIGSVSLSGSNAPLTANAPTQIMSESYSNLPVGTTTYFNSSGVLSRNARARTFIVNSNLDQPITVTYRPYESAVGYVGQANGDIFNPAQYSAGNINPIHDSGVHRVLAAKVDSMTVGITVGSTALTTGSYKLLVTELI